MRRPDSPRFCRTSSCRTTCSPWSVRCATVVLVVVLDPDARTVAAREAARSKTAYRAGMTVDSLQQSLRQRTPRLGLWLDTSGQTPAQTVDEILARGWQEARVEH